MDGGIYTKGTDEKFEGYFTSYLTRRTFTVFNQNKIKNWGDKCNRASAITIVSAFTDMTDEELIEKVHSIGESGKPPLSGPISNTTSFFGQFGLGVSGGGFKSEGDYREIVKASLKSGKYIAMYINEPSYKGKSGKKWTTTAHWVTILGYKSENGVDKIFVGDVGHHNTGWYDIDEFIEAGNTSKISILYVIYK